MALSPNSLMRIVAVGYASLVAIANATPQQYGNFDPKEIITRDVCIIGGGATGTYAAVRLQEDMHKSVIVVEKEGQLGGHAHTYIDPATGFPVDYGVLAYLNLNTTTAFFNRFNITLTTAMTPPFQNLLVDLSTGKPDPVTAQDPTTALGIYIAQLQKYPYLVGGFALPEPIPSDLLMPFKDFVKKYHIEAAIPIIWLFTESVGDPSVPTLYVMQNAGLVQMQSLQTGLLVTTNHVNSELYQKAGALLGSNVLYHSRVTSGYRSSEGHEIIVRTPNGRRVIRAKKLLITIPPQLSNLDSFQLDQQETSVFKQWKWNTYFCGILRKSGISDGVSITNSNPQNLFHLPSLPAITHIDFSGVPGLHTFRMVAKAGYISSQAKIEVLKAVARLNGTTPEIAAFRNHSPTNMMVSAEEIKNGFYKKLYALQGHKGTYYTGAAWAADYSSLLWQFTEGILPLIAA